MKLTDDRLIGWLCIMRASFANGPDEEGGTFNMPNVVREQLVERGWIVVHRDVDAIAGLPQGVTITPAGHAVSDLNAPEWGINPIPQESK